jgi:hypothetical protein
MCETRIAGPLGELADGQQRFRFGCHLSCA